MENKSLKRKSFNHLKCNFQIKRLKIPPIKNTDFTNKKFIVKFLKEKISEININDNLKKILTDKLLKTFQTRRSCRILNQYKSNYFKIQKKKRKGDGTFNAKNHNSIVISSNNYLEKIIEVDFNGGLGEKIVKKFVNEVISQEFAGLFSNKKIKIPKIINWGYYNNNNIEGLYIRMEYIKGKKLKKNVNKIISNKIKNFILELLNKYYFYHGDINKNNILIDKDDNIWIIDWGEATFTETLGFIKSFNL